MKPSEVIDTALAKFLPDADHWMQNDWYDGTRCCILGALDLASAAERERHEVYHQARIAVNNAIIDGGSGYCSVSGFNDAPSRTYDEVREVMEKARAGLQEKGL